MTLVELKEKIEALVPDSTVYVLDPRRDGQHLLALVISPVFEGMPLIKQHQMVMTPLKEDFSSSLHALGLKTFTPEKWATAKRQYHL